jgi:hypothetical protein
VHALDRSATVTGGLPRYQRKFGLFMKRHSYAPATEVLVVATLISGVL